MERNESSILHAEECCARPDRGAERVADAGQGEKETRIL